MVSNYDPDPADYDGLPGLHTQHQRHGPRWHLDDYDDIIDGDTIAVDLQLLDNLAAAVDAYDHDDDMPRVRTALAVFDAARALLADAAGNEVTP